MAKNNFRSALGACAVAFMAASPAIASESPVDPSVRPPVVQHVESQEARDAVAIKLTAVLMVAAGLMYGLLSLMPDGSLPPPRHVSKDPRYTRKRTPN